MSTNDTKPVPATISLGWLLLIAVVLRVPAVLFSQGYSFLDEQYQYIDPAWHLATGAAWYEPDDYLLGIRSWVYPGFLAGIFAALHELGLENPADVLRGARAVHGLVSLIPVVALWLFLRWRGLPAKRWFLIFVAGNFLAVLAGVRTNGAYFAANLSIAAIFLFHGPRLWPLLAGILLGIAFTCRFQDAFFGPVLFLIGAVRKRYRAVWLLCLGAALPVLLQGMLDLYLHGRFLHSALAYVEFNVLAARNADWGQEPWYFYILVILVALLALPLLLRVVWEHLRDGARVMPGVLAASLIYFFLHSAPEHKSVRFVVPAILLLWTVFAWRLFDREENEGWQRYGHRWLFVSLHVIAWVFCSFFFWNRGPVLAAQALHAQPELRELWIVDGSPVAVGGYLHLDRRELEVLPMSRARFERALTEVDWPRQREPIHVLVAPGDEKQGPLDLEGYSEAPFVVEELGAFDDWPVVKRRNRRWAYRFTRKMQ